MWPKLRRWGENTLVFCCFGVVLFFVDLLFRTEHHVWQGELIFGGIAAFYAWYGYSILRERRLRREAPARPPAPLRDPVAVREVELGRPLTLLERKILTEKSPSVPEQLESLRGKIEASTDLARRGKMLIHQIVIGLGAVLLTLLLICMYLFRLVNALQARRLI